MTYRRTHPVYILEGVYRFIPLLLVPLLRGFAAALKGGIYLWLKGAWLDILVVAVIGALAVARWMMTRYAFDGETICLKGGLFKYTDVQVPIGKVCSISCESPWFYRPFFASRIRFDTLAGTKHKADISLTLPTSTALNIMASVRRDLNADGAGMQRVYVPRLRYIMIISAFLSDSFAGVAFAAAFVTRLGSIAGKELEKQLVGTFNSIVKLLSFGIPPVAAAIAYIIMGGWVIGFLVNLVRHQKFTLCRDRNTLLVKGGRVTPRSTLLRADQISFINIKQGLFTKLLGIYTVFGYCAGVGKKKEDITALTPAGNKTEIEKSIQMLLPEFEPTEITLRPNVLALFRYIGDPVLPCIALPLVTMYLEKSYPAWGDLIFFVGFMICIPVYWWLAVRMVDFATSGIGVNENGATLRYSEHLRLNTAVIPWDRIVMIKLRQSILQRLDKKCDVFVYTRSETPHKHRVRNVDTETARRLLRVKKDG